MRSDGSPAFLHAVRRLAASRLQEGLDPTEVAEHLGVHRSSVYRWAAALRHEGWAGLAPAAVPGRPPKLTPRQSDRVLSWVRDRSPQDLGFAADAGSHWTARRLAAVIRARLGVNFNHRYLNDWLARHAISPQLPQRVPRERDEAAVARWVAYTWPAIKRGRPTRARPSCSPTKQAF
jgi:transposase